VSRCERRDHYRYRQFYLTYPQIVATLSPQLAQQLGVRALSSAGAPRIVESAAPQSGMDGKALLSGLSFSHFLELMAVEDATQRAFYEGECQRGNWSVRELRRQIGSLYYERSGLSKDKGKLAALARRRAERAEPTLSIRDPYVFEFLGLKPREVMGESHLDDQMLDKLHDFLLELGHGFCFEARQKRILLGDSHLFVDLVFYHRILKCHVLVEL
jgi:predicted nuclease of restriction endonuclease-like (RecB) superfamily